MSKSIILFKDFFEMESIKIKKIKDLNLKHVKYVMLPIYSNSEIQKFLILNAKNFITHFKKCIIKYTFRIEFFIDDTVDPIILPEVSFEPKNILDLYEILSNLSFLTYLFNVMNSNTDFGQYCELDIEKFYLDIEGSNFGDICINEEISENTFTEVRYLFADEIIHKIKDIYDPINRHLSHNERIHILNNQWCLTKSICDDGIYGLKLYPDSIIFIDENTYKMIMKMIPKKIDCYFDIISYDRQSYEMRNIERRNHIFLNQDSVISVYTSQIYSPEDLLQSLLYIEQLKSSMMLIENIFEATEPENLGITFIYTFSIGRMYRYDYGEFPDLSFGNIEIVVDIDKINNKNIVTYFIEEYKRQSKILKGE